MKQLVALWLVLIFALSLPVSVASAEDSDDLYSFDASLTSSVEESIGYTYELWVDNYTARAWLTFMLVIDYESAINDTDLTFSFLTSFDSYVGAKDGILHALFFDRESGIIHTISYIPSYPCAFYTSVPYDPTLQSASIDALNKIYSDGWFKNDPNDISSVMDQFSDLMSQY